MPNIGNRSDTTAVTLAAPADRAQLAAEIATCQQVAAPGKLEVYDLHGDDAPTVMHEIGRIREREYRAIGAGRNVAVDLDHFDTAPQRYRQIVVWDPAAGELVAMYRYVLAAEVLATLGEDGLRTHTMFNYSPRFRDEVLTHAVELGRSVVNSEAASALRGLHAVWFGLASIVLRNRSIEYFFGNVTIPATMPAAAVAHLLAMLRVVCAPGAGLTAGDVAAINRLDAQRYQDAATDGYTGGDHRAALATLRERLSDYNVTAPPILLSYLKRSRRLWAFESARDPDFGEALEAAIVVPVATLTDDARRAFLRNER